MTAEIIRDALAWSTAINYAVLLFWALMIIFAHDWVYRFHSKWFSIPTEAFDTIHYAGIACYKIVMFLFNLAPYLALLIVL